jgi:hypothetical protein
MQKSQVYVFIESSNFFEFENKIDLNLNFEFKFKAAAENSKSNSIFLLQHNSNFGPSCPAAYHLFSFPFLLTSPPTCRPTRPLRPNLAHSPFFFLLWSPASSLPSVCATAPRVAVPRLPFVSHGPEVKRRCLLFTSPNELMSSHLTFPLKIFKNGRVKNPPHRPTASPPLHCLPTAKDL